MEASLLLDAELPPDVFAVVMATAIVSVAADTHGYPEIGDPLGVLAAVCLVLLAAWVALRVAARPGQALGAARDPDVALRLFTSVAACTVVGVRMDARAAVVWGLGIAAVGMWLLLVPLAARDVWSRTRAELRRDAHGAWLLPGVASFGLAITAADLAVHSRRPALVLAGAAGWVLGIAAYVSVTWLIAGRALAAPFVPEEVTPDSWILMGALAIATLAGDHLIAAADALGGLGWLASAARPATLAAWVLASLWIPVLLYAEVWRVDQRAGSVHYAGVWWSAVFPLGMYSAATAATSAELHHPALLTVSLVFFWIAFTLWLLVAVGAVHVALAGLRHGR